MSGGLILDHSEHKLKLRVPVTFSVPSLLLPLGTFVSSVLALLQLARRVHFWGPRICCFLSYGVLPGDICIAHCLDFLSFLFRCHIPAVFLPELLASLPLPSPSTPFSPFSARFLHNSCRHIIQSSWPWHYWHLRIILCLGWLPCAW